MIKHIPRPSTSLFSYLSSGSPPAQIPLSPPCQKAQPQISTFKPQVPLKSTQIEPSLFVHSIPLTFPII